MNKLGKQLAFVASSVYLLSNPQQLSAACEAWSVNCAMGYSDCADPFPYPCESACWEACRTSMSSFSCVNYTCHCVCN